MNMHYRLLALDLDGTLLTNALAIRADSLHMIQALRDRGMEAIIVTGRHPVAAHAYWEQLGFSTPVIGCNGACLYDYRSRQALHDHVIRPFLAQRVVRLIRTFGIYSMIYTGEGMAFEPPLRHYDHLEAWSRTLPARLRPRFLEAGSLEAVAAGPDRIWKFATVGDDPAALVAFEHAVAMEPGLRSERSAPNRVDVAAAGVSKGSMLVRWLHTADVAPSQVVAFGDQKNDIDMLEFAGLGIAMGNADEEVKAHAQWVTGSNEGPGIAEALGRILDGAGLD
jgi:hypothetical protein